MHDLLAHSLLLSSLSLGGYSDLLGMNKGKGLERISLHGVSMVHDAYDRMCSVGSLVLIV